MLNLYVPPSRALKIDSRADSTCGVLISAKLIYGISMHVIYCSCVNGSNLDQSLVILHNWRRGWDPK